MAAQIRRVHRGIVRHYDEKLKGLGITVAQLDILITLLHEGGSLRPTDLAKEMLMDRSTVSRNVSRLAYSHLIEIMSGSNGREQLIEVTKKGKRVVAAAEDLWGAAQDEVSGVLGHEGVKALELLSGKVGQEG